jgi:drug/metabolite transporter (DMT)-like permease
MVKPLQQPERTMLFLLLHILISSSFGLVVKHGQQRRLDLLTLGAVNYIAAALWFWGPTLAGGGFHLDRATVIVGVFGGVAYVVSYLFLLQVMRYTGISIPMAIVRLSVLIPIVASIFVWHEAPNVWQVFGIALTCVALPCFGLDARTGHGNGRGFAGPVAMIALLFLTTGGCSLATKAFHETGLEAQKPQFLLCLFHTAALVAVAAWGWDRWRGGRRDRLAAAGPDPLPIASRAIPLGLLLGTINASGNLLLLFALDQLPGMIVFPVSSSLGVVFTLLVAAYLWGERIGTWGRAGMALSVAAVVLLNLR